MATSSEISIEQRLKSLYKLQLIDTQIDKLKSHRGELPIEVSDLEDEIEGMQTRLSNFSAELKKLEESVSQNKTRILDAKALAKKYEKQLENVKNNREYEALTKEIEMQGLEQQAAEKRIKSSQFEMEQKKQLTDALKAELDGRLIDLNIKKNELDTIIAETEKEEAELMKIRDKAAAAADDRLVTSYDRIRKSVKNGIGVAMIMRDSCGGCFAGIPPQRQADIKQRKKIIVCENCGRVIVDADLANDAASDIPKK